MGLVKDEVVHSEPKTSAKLYMGTRIIRKVPHPGSLLLVIHDCSILQRRLRATVISKPL